MVTGENLDEAMDYFAHAIEKNDFPSDGLVALYDDIAYGDSLGRTAKFPRNAFAFKWADEMVETTLEQIEWSPSRTGLINPVGQVCIISALCENWNLALVIGSEFTKPI